MKPILNTCRRHNIRIVSLCLVIAVLTITSVRLSADTAICGGGSVTLPFTDVPAANVFFCSIAEAFFSGLTNGTDATHYSPSANVPREQMAAFVTRTLDQSLKRGSRRAALGQWWRPSSETDLATTTVGNLPSSVKSDGSNLWVANSASSTVSRIDPSTGGITGTWTGAVAAQDLLVAKGRVFVLGQLGDLYQIDPSQAPGPVSTVTTGLGSICFTLTFDGSNIWGVSIGSHWVFKVTLNPVSSQFFTAGFVTPAGIIFDGSNIWVTDQGDHLLKKLNPGGTVAISVSLPGASAPGFPAFDGLNLWVPDPSDRVFVVRSKDAAGNPVTTPSVLATLTGNGLVFPNAAAFDGERILITNNGSAPDAGVSLWKAADFSPIGSVATTNPALAVCSDGINFWFTLNPGFSTPGKLARF